MIEEHKLLQLVSKLPLEKCKMTLERAFAEDDVHELRLESNLEKIIK